MENEAFLRGYDVIGRNTTTKVAIIEVSIFIGRKLLKNGKKCGKGGHFNAVCKEEENCKTCLIAGLNPHREMKHNN